MSKTTKIAVVIIATVLIGSFGLLLSVATCGLFSAIALPAYFKTVNKVHKNDEIKLKKSLETSMHIYKLDQNKTPENFSDFVVLSGKAEPPYTFSFSNFENSIIKPDCLENLKTTKLRVEFRHGITAVYTLTPTGVEMSIQ